MLVSIGIGLEQHATEVQGRCCAQQVQLLLSRVIPVSFFWRSSRSACGGCGF